MPREKTGKVPEEGEKAPDFRLKDQNGKGHSLSDYRGKRIALYFYPKDDTPGCTIEACSFRGGFAELKKAGIIVLGVSMDSAESHGKFANKYSLPFPLLADTEGKVCKAYGTLGEKSFFGKKIYGIKRATFLIGADGKIAKIFMNVKPDGHANEVIGAFG
ncbi:MAG: thioredoxin-dependent thiol peroxidase [archaeon]